MKLLNGKESHDYLPVKKGSFEEVIGSKSNSTTFAELRFRKEIQTSHNLLR
jgi:hypothetical protein